MTRIKNDRKDSHTAVTLTRSEENGSVVVTNDTSNSNKRKRKHSKKSKLDESIHGESGIDTMNNKDQHRKQKHKNDSDNTDNNSKADAEADANDTSNDDNTPN